MLERSCKICELIKPTHYNLAGKKISYNGKKKLCAVQKPSNEVKLWFLAIQPDKMAFVLPSAKNSTCGGVTGVETGYCVSRALQHCHGPHHPMSYGQ